MIDFILRRRAFIFILLSAFYIIGSSYVGLNGNHVWRQSDSYSQILGFVGYKNIAPLDDFFGRTVLYDVAIYQYIVAQISVLTGADPLVATKYFNLFLWIVMLLGGGLLVEKFSYGASIFFFCLCATSPLLLHYFSSPLPDVMATAFSLTAIAILMRVRRWYWVAILLLAIAALIKSPVPFVFLVYYFFWRVLSREGDGFISRGDVFVYLAALFFAISAEIVRKNVLGTNVAGFAQDPWWYFGSLDQRLSADFWSMIMERLVGSGSFDFVTYGLFSIICIYILIGKKTAGLVALPFLMAFFSGWLVFSNVFFAHDYYEIPVTVVFYIFCSVALGEVLKFGCGLFMKTKFSLDRSKAVFVVVVIVAISSLLYGRRISDFHSESVFDSARFALKNSDSFLWVNDESDGPSIGGLVKTKFRRVTATEFEGNCQKLLGDNEAILVKGWSYCLFKNKKYATTYIEGDGIQVYVNRNNYYYNALSGLKPDSLVSDSFFSVYRLDQGLLYVRRNCAVGDYTAQFFLHVFNGDEVRNFDFNFSDGGAYLDGVCVVLRKIEGIDVRRVGLETGQFVGEKRLWQANYSGPLSGRRVGLERYSRPVADGSPWNGEGNIVFNADGVFIDFYEAKKINGIDVSLDNNDSYRLELFLRGNLVGVLLADKVVSVPVGMARRALKLGKSITVDGVRVLPLEGDGAYSFGYIGLSI